MGAQSDVADEAGWGEAPAAEDMDVDAPAGAGDAVDGGAPRVPPPAAPSPFRIPDALRGAPLPRWRAR